MRNQIRIARFIWAFCGTLAAALAISLCFRTSRTDDSFTRLMSRGKGYLEKGDTTNAITTYAQAIELAPEDINVRLNLANAYLLGGSNAAAIDLCQEVLKLDRNNAAAYYLTGCAYMRLEQPEPALKAFDQSQNIDPAVTALSYQLGLAQAKLGHVDDAIHDFQTVIQFEPEHPSAHYQLSQLLQQAGRANEAASELQKHQQILAANPNNASSGAAAFESCKYTRPQVAFVLEQPPERGIPVRFVEATSTAFGAAAGTYHGPLTVMDYNHDGRNSLFVMEGDKGFRLLDNRQGHFEPLGKLLPCKPGAAYRACLTGDLDNGGFEDAIVLGEEDSHVFKFDTNGQIRDVTKSAGLGGLTARTGVLADLDFTGKLDLLAVLPGGRGLRVYRNLGNFYFVDNTTNSGLPAVLPGIEGVTTEDWNSESLPGIFVARAGHPPEYFAKERAGAFVETNFAADWPAGSVVATGDLNNDLQPDLVVAGESEITVIFGGIKERINLPLRGLHVKGLLLIDYDNDGWLDILAYGDNGARVWRNRGHKGFADVTADLGFDQVSSADSIVAADFDGDGDTDLIVSSSNGLHFWRNDGGNANRQFKIRLAGHRSNASALGVRVELTSGQWRTSRTVHELPLEIGVGQHDKLDSLKVHWFDLATTLVDVPVEAHALTLDELTLPTGSCPNLYAWDGQRFKFVTDILGAAPLGLPLTETRFIEADPEEYLALGSDQRFPAKNGAYEVRVTEELREVLYLDAASLVVVDHPEGTLVYPTSKMHAGKPFPPHELWTLRPVAPLRQATRNDGLDVTEALASVDGRMVSPVRLRQAQLRGLAEPFSVTMDFGPLAVDRPLVLALTGWLRFGGGMANVAASLDSTLPLPFPTIETQLPDGSWKPVAADVGTPAGKTKTILVDLQGKLPPGAMRLRLTTAFEIHWDCAALCEKVSGERNRQTTLAPDHADLHWRGFSRYANLPDWLPLTPEYDQIVSTPPWDRTPSGWCTRYGAVDELVRERDDKLALLNGGDELALSFQASRLPPKPSGFARDFFLYVVGWDKDADFHVGHGWAVDPLPFRGMDDQSYDRRARPDRPDDGWIREYNTRWVGPMVLSRRADALPTAP
jgi:tetratricopeptide (TPR) repeat protein